MPERAAPRHFAHLPEALRHLRIESGFSQEDLAAAAGVRKQLISNYERGKTNPRLDNLALILAGLDVSLAELATALEFVESAPPTMRRRVRTRRRLQEAPAKSEEILQAITALLKGVARDVHDFRGAPVKRGGGNL